MTFVTVLTLGALPLVFLDSTSIEDAQGVRVEARLPARSEVLLEADPAKPSLWMMPTAVQQKPEGAWIWYQRVDKAEPDYADQRTLCVAVLEPAGLRLPSVDESSPSWGGPNNVVLRRSPHKPTWGGFNVFQMIAGASGYTLLYWDQPAEGDAGAMLAHSNDGLHWQKDPRGTVFTEHNDAYSILAKDGGYLLYQTMLAPWPDKPYADNLDKFRRVQAIRESKDLVTWTAQEVLLTPDAQDDPTTEFYLMKAFPYGQAFAALLMKYYADPQKPKEHSGILSYELLVSDDARSWRRPYRDINLGFWSYAEPFDHQGMLTFAAHHERNITIFQYRPEGLTCVTAEEQGSFITVPFTMPEQGVAINTDSREGSIEVRLLDADKHPIPGAETARVESQDGTEVNLPWDGRTTNGKECRLALSMKNASVFSIRPRRP